MSSRIRRWLWWSILPAVVLALLAFADTAARLLVVDMPQPSDVIVVLAGETDRRPALGFELLDKGYARRLLIDVPASARVYDSTMIQIAERYIRRRPDSSQVEICPIWGLSTRDEALDVEKCLSQERASSVLIVTSDYHTRRALSIFRHEIDGRKFSVAAALDNSEFGRRWWTHREWAKTCMYEWMRLIWWSAIDRWR